jgi:hypothetical protein
MPRWARFLSCTFTGLLIAFIGLLQTAYWYEGSEGYWYRLLGFVTTSAFWYLAALFGLLASGGLLLGRLAVNIYMAPPAFAGLCAGALVAAAYALFLISSHAPQWGGVASGLQKSWPAALYFLAPFAGAGAFTTWLWDRLD